MLEKSLVYLVRYYLYEIEEIYDFNHSLVKFIKTEHSLMPKGKDNLDSKWFIYWKNFSGNIIQNRSSRLFKMVHISLIVLFEAFNKDFFTILLSAKPECMKSSNKQLNYKEIIGFESLDKLYEFLASEITGNFGRENIDDLADFINKKFNIELNLKFNEWEQLREMYYRRNLVVHNKSKISYDYISKIDGFSLNDIDKELDIDYVYVKDCFDLLWGFIEVLFKEIVDKFRLNVDPKKVLDLDYPDSRLFENVD